jgi:exopolysaccharide biosynthesis polyprenyl glycosylphosphotransferase
MYKQYHPYKLLLIVADFWITFIVLVIAEYFRPFMPGLPVEYSLIIRNSSIYFFAPFLFHVLFALTGVYDYRRISSLAAQITRLTFSYSLAIWVFAGLLFFTFRDTSRLLVIYFSVLNYLALVGIRCVVRVMIEKKHVRAQDSRVVILGGGDRAKLLTETIKNEIGPVFRLVGFADFAPPKDQELSAHFLGMIEDIESIIKEHDVNVVIIALETKYYSYHLEHVVETLMRLPVRIYLAPDYVQLALVEAEVDQLGNIVLIGIREPVIQGGKRFSKRIMDIVLSVIVFLLTWPMFIVIWIAIKLDSEGPGIFSASRIGEGGKTFKMYKFRTMIAKAENLQQSVTQTDEKGHKIYKTQNDPRVTRVGRFLRKTSLDELPQLINVLKGDMSLVGPRPEQPFITKEYDTWQWQRVLVPPGVTGWWQISGRSDLPMHLNTNYDIYYVRNYSIYLDLKILFKTIIEVLRGKGAY